MDTLIPAENEAFPVLTAHQLELVRRYGAVEEHAPQGTLLLEEGDRDYDWLVILEGELQIAQHAQGAERLIVVHGPGQFIGDTHSLSGRAAVVLARAKTDLRYLRLPRAQLRRLVVERSELSDTLMRAFLSRRTALVENSFSSCRLIGSRYSSDTHRIREFLTRNQQPYEWIDIEKDPEIDELLSNFGLTVDQTPVLISRASKVVLNPSNEDIASCLGLDVVTQDHVVDLLVVGSGPAGLAATVYAASEGLEVVSIDSTGPGGQAGTSSKIENYLGFPQGISGRELADRALQQAQKFGAQLASARTARKLQCEGSLYSVTFCDGATVQARGLIIATGARYNKLDLPNLRDYEGQGVYYACTAMEQMLCKNSVVAVVGGANSAGQAAVFLSSAAREVHLLVRGDSLEKSMSKYLIRRIQETENIFLHVHCRVTELIGQGHLERVKFHCASDDSEHELECASLFTMVGAVPNTDWLSGCVALDAKGFVRTGRDLTDEDLARSQWKLNRMPYLYETSQPRVFAVGDVRSDSTKRVATAVGEGSAAIMFMHRALAELD